MYFTMSSTHTLETTARGLGDSLSRSRSRSQHREPLYHTQPVGVQFPNLPHTRESMTHVDTHVLWLNARELRETNWTNPRPGPSSQTGANQPPSTSPPIRDTHRNLKLVAKLGRHEPPTTRTTPPWTTTTCHVHHTWTENNEQKCDSETKGCYDHAKCFCAAVCWCCGRVVRILLHLRVLCTAQHVTHSLTHDGRLSSSDTLRQTWSAQAMPACCKQTEVGQHCRRQLLLKWSKNLNNHRNDIVSSHALAAEKHKN